MTCVFWLNENGTTARLQAGGMATSGSVESKLELLESAEDAIVQGRLGKFYKNQKHHHPKSKGYLEVWKIR